MPVTSQQIKTWAREIGFDLVGVAAALPLDTANADAFQGYLRQGRDATMGYLARTARQRLDPRQFLPNARAIICTATNYYSPEPAPPQEPDKQNHTLAEPCPLACIARYARYARLPDYHHLIRRRLGLLKQRIAEACPQPVRLRCCVDTAPLAEKYHGAQAGIGWIGRNSLLIHPTIGSYLLLGEIVTDLPLEPDQPLPDHCGRCTACLDACPTGALTAPHSLDGRRCLSYWTTQADQLPPADIAKHLAGRLFGCDTCQDVCPFNQNPPPTTDPALQGRPQWTHQSLCELISLSDEALTARFAGSPIGRVAPAHLRQLARISLQNTCQPPE